MMTAKFIQVYCQP